ncbi:MAG: hypothetical protein CMM28_15145 [Rhodospirillaceae bacterium]|nr:hypothetical protein [Rhodospirillaceae bacterium]|tara:strand:+ start:2180 stop:2485 length:306 start_codon:yes stop_codon:yes gene_type:complete
MSDSNELSAPELDPVAQAILEHLSLQNPPQDVKPVAVAKFYAEKRSKPGTSPNLWRRYLSAVRQQAKFLARSGKITIIHRGQLADPDTVKGLVKYRLGKSG